jgi:hypothetical protein
MKTCIDCKLELDESQFELRKDTGKLRSQCNLCYKLKKSVRRKARYVENNEYDPEKRHADYMENRDRELARASDYYKDNKEYIDNRNLTYYHATKEERLKYAASYRENNVEKVQARHSKYRLLNKNQINSRASQYRLANPEKIKATRHKHFANPENRIKRRATANAYIKHRRKTDPVFVLKERFKNRTRKVFAKKLGKKSIESITALLGCSPEFFKGYFESKFTEGMTWELVHSGAIEIDHRIPISIGDTEEQLIKLSHYTNLQPMWKLENQEKSDTVPEGLDLPF